MSHGWENILAQRYPKSYLGCQALRHVPELTMSHFAVWISSALLALAALSPAFGADEFAVDLPGAVRAVWDPAKAYRETTPTFERLCLNGLWRWQPAAGPNNSVPTGQWGYFKVPGPWPGVTGYMQKDCQTLYRHPAWGNSPASQWRAAWYEREITIPENWSGRRVALQADYLNSFGIVYVDGKRTGEVRFPGGELDLTAVCIPGRRHTLSLLVLAMPLKGVLLSYTDSAAAREVKGSVARRGLCGDVYLIGTRAGPRIADARVFTSVRREEITFQARLPGLEAARGYRVRARISQAGQVVAEFTSKAWQPTDLTDGHAAFTNRWKPSRLWDLHTPFNQSECLLSLIDDQDRILDETRPIRFGFRELSIEGRDFYLNGSRIFLSAVPLDNAEIGAAWATYQAARESLERLKSFGINFVYTHNYGCEPGSHLNFEQILSAADDTGMLVALSQPHFSHYEWKFPEADQTNGYLKHAEFYAAAAGNHPSVVFYAMSHNATGYEEDMNPDLIDGIHAPRDRWSRNNADLALRAEAIVRAVDPSRVVYHHASGNLGSMHAINFYPNFVPIQELSDWFGHWAQAGVKPAFMCEYGAPFTWDWTMYRGWYKGQREFGSARVPWEFCLAEWNAQFFGDRAYQISDPEKANLRWEAGQFRAGNLWHRWDYPAQVGSTRFDERYPVFAKYLTQNWRAFRGWGVSAISPWEYGHFWKLREGASKARQDFKVDWENLQRPGFSPDYIDQRLERIDLAFEKSDWIPTEVADALFRNNRGLLAFIAGRTNAFTSQDHNFYPGETVEKQLIVINNSRQTVAGELHWSALPAKSVEGRARFTLPTGEQRQVPISIPLRDRVPPGEYELNATVKFDNGETQSDRFVLHVVARQAPPKLNAKTALFDPKGETAAWLTGHRVPFDRIDASADLARYSVLIVGKSAFTLDGRAPDISKVAKGLKVLIFEQSAEVLEKRFGFRVQEYGLRTVWERVPDHPILAGLSSAQFSDWRGAATMVPPTRAYELPPRYGPTVRWCDIPVPRLWRCGNRGNLASVLIEKPGRGDFLPILDGGYSLQYSPLLEYREGQGLILFCQLDVTGRTENDPAAETIAGNILNYLQGWQPSPARNLLYAGEPAGQSHLQAAGLSVETYDRGKLSPAHLLVAGPGAGAVLGAHKEELAKWLQAGGTLMAVGLDQSEANSFLPSAVRMTSREHIATWFAPVSRSSFFVGIAPADLHNRDPREIPLISEGATLLGNGVLAWQKERNVIFCQLAPWKFHDPGKGHLRRTYRRTAFMLERLLANLGARGSAPILSRFATPVTPAANERRWLDGLYLDQPEEWDDPYRFFRW